jgi:hypothetical protein
MFEGPRLKVKRANQHIADLNKAIEAFIKTDFYTFGIENDPNTGDQFLRFKMTKEPPCELPLIIGDAIHNLRSSLDLAYCEILIAIGETPTDYSRFIFEEDRDKLVAKLKSGPMKAAADIIDIIADFIKPYATAQNPLYILHNLDISDKHLLLIPTFGIAQLRNINAQIFMGNSVVPNVTIANITLTIDQNGGINFIGWGGGAAQQKIKFEGKGDPSFSVRFGKGQALEGQPIVPTLHQLSQIVGGVLEILEKAVLNRQAAGS